MQRFKAQSELYGDVKSLTETIRPRESGITNWVDATNRYSSMMDSISNTGIGRSIKALNAVNRGNGVGNVTTLSSALALNEKVSDCPAMR